MSKLKIYGIPGSRAARVLWCANELGLDYENIAIHFADQTSKTPDYLKVNPMGKVPALDDDGFQMTESLAINCYLAQKYDRQHQLWPTALEAQAKVLQWTLWVATECERPYIVVLRNRAFFPPEKRDPKAADEAEAELQRPFKVLDAALAKDGYLIGQSFTLADLNVAAVLAWALTHGRFNFGSFPHLAKWHAACLARPAYRKVPPRAKPL